MVDLLRSDVGEQEGLVHGTLAAFGIGGRHEMTSVVA